MNITYVTDEGGDWAGLYVDGKLVDQNHSLDVGMVFADLARLGYNLEYSYFEIKETAWDSLGHLPEALDEIPEDAKCV